MSPKQYSIRCEAYFYNGIGIAFVKGMNIENTLKTLIHREMRARFMWHQLEKFEKENHGFSFTIAVKSIHREYASAANLVAVIKKHFKDVHLLHTANYSTVGNENIYAISISCQNPKIIPLPARQHQGNNLRAA
jgi:hypothetical protein